MTNEEICVWLKAEAEPNFSRFTSGLTPRNRSDHRCAYPKAAHSCKKDCKRGLARVFGTRCLRYL